MNNPISKFKHWWQQAALNTPLIHQGAACLATINKEGYPEGRFVDLKEVSNNGFTFCTYLDSSKGIDISRNPKVSLTFWWEHVGYQVRIVGTSEAISSVVASKFWLTRNRDAQLTSLCFAQSKPLASTLELAEKFKIKSQQMVGKTITKPESWGGFIIKPVSIEFLTFNENRLHLRELFSRVNDQWCISLLQP